MIKFFVKWVLLPFVLVVGYLGFFVYNTLAGGYFLERASDGTTQKILGVVSVSNAAILWQPRHGYHTADRSDLLGTIYAPLIKLDRRFLHQTHYLNKTDTWGWLKDLPPEKVHPEHRGKFKGVQDIRSILGGDDG